VQAAQLGISLDPSNRTNPGRNTKRERRNRETGQWIEWMGANFSVQASQKKVDEMFNHWTRNDYQAAGHWLTTAPDVPTKHTAIRAYANAISSYEPESAVQWAMTLPPDQDREVVLKKIYQNWPKKDDVSKAAAEAFKQQHEIK
jgi:hypothetical protein